MHTVGYKGGSELQKRTMNPQNQKLVARGRTRKNANAGSISMPIRKMNQNCGSREAKEGRMRGFVIVILRAPASRSLDSSVRQCTELQHDQEQSQDTHTKSENVTSLPIHRGIETSHPIRTHRTLQSCRDRPHVFPMCALAPSEHAYTRALLPPPRPTVREFHPE